MKAYLFLVSACCFATAAQAGGPVVMEVEPVPVAPVAMDPGYDWTGFYLGVSASSGTFNDGTADFDTSGYGVQAGYLRDLGTFVVGGELSYSQGDYDGDPDSDWDATRLKLIGGFDAGRLLPYAFVGLTNYNVNQAASASDTMTNYGIGAKFAFGDTGRLMLGLEYLTESADDFDGTGLDVDNHEVSLRLDYRF